MSNNVNNVKKYTPTEKEKKLVEWVYSKFKQAYVAKAPLMDEWKKYMSAYKGTYFKNQNLYNYLVDDDLQIFDYIYYSENNKIILKKIDTVNEYRIIKSFQIENE